MARKSGANAKQPPKDTLQPNTLVLDNGAHTIKAGFAPPPNSTTAPDPEKDCHIIANCIARSQRDRRTYVGAELLDECWDFGELAFRRPVERGYVVNWEGEKAIWERSLLGKGSKLGCEPERTNLLLTEAPGAPAALQRNADEMVFEEFGFGGLWRTTGGFPTLAAGGGYVDLCLMLPQRLRSTPMRHPRSHHQLRHRLPASRSSASSSLTSATHTRRSLLSTMADLSTPPAAASTSAAKR